MPITVPRPPTGVESRSITDTAAQCLGNHRLTMPNHLDKLFARRSIACGLLLLIAFAGGCQARSGDRANAGGAMLQPVSLADPVDPSPVAAPLEVSGARNEWIGHAIQITDLPPQIGRAAWSVTLAPRSSRTGRPLIDAPRMLRSGYQVVPVPADLNRPDYVRQTGRPVPSSHPSGALLPLPVAGGRIDLAGLRDPANPAQPRLVQDNGPPILLWIDLHIPPGTPAGEYTASLDLHRDGSSRTIASIPLELTVYDFDLPDQPRLRIIGRLDWRRLETLFPRQFQQVHPRLISRAHPDTAPAVDVLDKLIHLAREHRTSIVLPRLQPTVKWGPAGRPPQIDWTDYDSLVSPWLEPSDPNHPDARMIWAIPEVDHLDRFDARTQLQYWQQAFDHFDDRQWLEQSILFRDRSSHTRPGQEERAHELQHAITLLEQHPQLTILLPNYPDELSTTDLPVHAAAYPAPVDEQAGGNSTETGEDFTRVAADDSTGPATDPPHAPPPASPRPHRLLLRGPGPVFSTARNGSPAEPRIHLWLAPGPGSSTGAGIANAEPDLRLWAWLALLRNADTILWDGLLPRTQDPIAQQTPADTVWFYPGHWFGIEQPVPALQLKWLRRAQQDYEYLIQALSVEQDDLLDSHAMARLLVRPVKLPADRRPDPLHTLLSGTSDPAAWDEARRLLAQAIVLGRHEPRRPRPQDLAQRMELSLQAVHWTVPLARPVLIPRATAWSWPADTDDTTPGNWIDLRLDVEVYMPMLSTGHGNQIEWTSLPAGWSADPQTLLTPPLQTYEIAPIVLNARLNLNEIDPDSHRPLEVRFTDGYSGEHTPAQFAVPVAISRFRSEPILLDGSLEEWHAGEAIHQGPLIRMFSRPNLQQQALQPASTDSAVYTAWNDDALLLAFRLEDATAGGLWWRNFVDYQLRRAWGEDLAQLLIQPVYLDNTTGPVLHIVCKPRGQWVEQRSLHAGPGPAPAGGGPAPPPPGRQGLGEGETSEARPPRDLWQPVQGAGIRYASSLDERTWRGELAIPWEAILEPGRGRPALLRFNFSHHRHSSGESASWAGPVDFGRDQSMMGLLILRQLPVPGLIGAPRP